MQVGGLISLLPLLALLAAGAPSENSALSEQKGGVSGQKSGLSGQTGGSSGRKGGRGRAGKKGVVVRRRPPPGYHQESI